MLFSRALIRRLQAYAHGRLCRTPGHISLKSPVSRLSVNPRGSSGPIALANTRFRQYSGNTYKDGAGALIDDTIYAVSTGRGRAAIAVIRISGPACADILRSLCPGSPPLLPRVASLRTLYHPSASTLSPHAALDQALVLHFPQPHTVTGEDVLELHVHGGLAIVQAVLKAIPVCPTLSGEIRYAEPGEFTRRAFLNDRLDLTQAEALGDTLSAVTEQQRRQALLGARGDLARRYEGWRDKLIAARAELEALIDFQEDQHFDESPIILATSVAAQVKALKSQISRHVQNASRGELLRSGISVALIGRPNAGKSSLLNLIVGREAAIVSQEAGTTRDLLEVPIDIGGYLCRFVDTAGLRGSCAIEDLTGDAIGPVEGEGIKRAKQQALRSDFVVMLLSVLDEPNKGNILGLAGDEEVLKTAAKCATEGATIHIVVNKLDKLEQNQLSWESAKQEVVDWLALNGDIFHQQPSITGISCKCAKEIQNPCPDAGGIQALLETFSRSFHSMTCPLLGEQHTEVESSLGATERQRLLLEECLSSLDHFLAQVASLDEPQSTESFDVVIVAENLRSAAFCLSRITGRGDAGDVEELLGIVFEKFCVGK